MKKKINLYFAGECIIILLLLVIVGTLLTEEKANAWGKEAALEKDMEEADVMEENHNSGMDTELHSESVTSVKEWLGDNNSVSGNVQADSDSVSGNGQTRPAEGKKIVVFGDSIWDDGRGTDGISEQIMELTGATVYNCAIGGSTAAVISDPTDLREGWTSRSLNGMMYIATDAISADSILAGKDALEVIKEVDFSQVDYIIISYGLNDYFSYVPVYPQEYFDMTSYTGALRHAVAKLKEAYPDTKIIITSSTYCDMYGEDKEFPLTTYVELARGVAEEMEVSFLDVYHGLGINAETKNKYLEDGVHLSREGRKVYAEYAAHLINKLANQE